MANRYLVDFNFEEAPYYFGKVAETSYSKNSNIIDISYMDNIIAISEGFIPELINSLTCFIAKSIIVALLGGD